MQGSQQGDFGPRQAHYLCEQALAHAAQGDLASAQKQLEAAIAAAPGAPRHA